MLKALGGDVSEGPLEQMGIHSFINVHIHKKWKVDSERLSGILLTKRSSISAEPTFIYVCTLYLSELRAY